MNGPGAQPNTGVVVSVRGSVVDMRFETQLPPIYAILHAGGQQQIIIEVQSQRDATHGRGIALTPTQGLSRGTPVIDTGGPLKAPVGKAVLSRMFDVFGNTLDQGETLTGVEWRSVHRAPPPLVRRSTRSEVFETGIKIIDVLLPLPAVDVGKSVSPVGGKAQRAPYRAVAGALKLAFAQFEELETFARFGARLDAQTRNIIEHGRRIRACLKQHEGSPVSMSAQIAVLLALTHGQFDTVPLERMAEAEQAVLAAAKEIPTQISERFSTADKLSDADRQAVVDLTLQALVASSIGRYENAVCALNDYYRTVELGLSVCFRHQQLAPTAAHESVRRADQSVRIVVFGSDQGLVGQFNEQVVEHVMSFLSGMPDARHQVWAVGERVHARLIDAGTPTMGLFAVPNAVQTISSLVAKILLATQSDQRPDAPAALYLFFNRSQSGAGYEPESQRLLPLDDDWRRALVALPWPTGNLPDALGDSTATLRALIREYLFISLFRACAESLASENASRLAAMQRAEKNIDELLMQLRRTYHRVRQSSIDEELFDVVAGFDALSNTTDKRI